MARKNKSKEEPVKGKFQAGDDRSQMLLDSIMDAYAEIDMSGRLISCNHSFEELLGYAANEPKKITYKDITPVKWHEYENGIMEKEILVKGYSRIYEKEYIRKDGTVFPVELRTFLVRDKVGNSVSIWAIIRDISERKKAEEAIRASEERFKKFFDYSKDAIFVADPQTRMLLDCNLQAEKLTGRSRREIMSMRADDLHPKDVVDETMAIFKRQVSGEDITGESLVLAKDGQSIPVSINTACIEMGGKVSVVGIFRDITERKQAEKVLLKSKTQLQELFDNMNSGVAIYEAKDGGRDFIFKDMNKSGQRFSKVDRGQVIGKGVLEAFPGIEKIGLLEVFRQVLKTGVPQHHPVSFYQDDRISQWVENYVYKLPSGEIVAVYDDITERKQVEKALKEGEERYRSLVESANSAIIRWKNDGTILFFNDYALKFFGYGLDDVIGKHVSLILPEKESTGRNLSIMVEDIVDHPDRYINNINENICRDGRRVWMAWTNKAILDNNGQVVEMLAIGSDITERKQAEENLRASEALYRSLFENMLNGYAYCKMLYEEGKPKDFVYLAVNSAFEAQTGLKDVTGKKVSEVIPDFPEKDAELLNIFGRVSQKGPPEKFEIFLKALDMWFEVSVYCPEKDHFVAVFDVVTERKKAEEVLRNKTAVLEAQMDSTIDGILVVDKLGKKIIQNRRCIELWKIPRNIAEDTDDVIQLEHVKGMVKDPGRFLERATYLYYHPDEISRDEVELIDGTVLDRYSAPVLGKDGQNFGRIWVFRDITERKRAQEELRRAYKNLKDTQDQLMQSNKMSALGQLASGVAHELNNPLTGVLNNVQLIKMETEVRKDFNMDDFKGLLDVIEESALRCKKIAQSLLNFTHIGTGAFARISINDIMRKTIDLVSHELKLCNIAFKEELQNDLPMAKGDPQLLQQVFYGIFVNAKWAIEKKAREGGTITVKTAKNEQAGTIEISISDTGIGIPQENMPKLFTPFFTTKDVGEGTGLGLAIFYNIIKNHNGDIRLESQVGIGTTFIINLPF